MPLQREPFQIPPLQEVALVWRPAIEALLNGMPKMSFWPVSATPLETT
jgi:hypothetical protein